MAPKDLYGRDEEEVYIVGHCKQCNKPMQPEEVVEGPLGAFCSEKCRDQYEAFVERAAAMESSTPPKFNFLRL